MKILIIGAAGMLGQELVKIFSPQNEVVAWDKDDLDITDESMVKGKIAALKPDLIINSAAFNNVDACETDFVLALKINGDAPVNLAAAAEAVGAVFIHYSTDYVFPGDKKEGYGEDDAPSPISKYGESKLLGERALQNYSRCYLIRTSRLYGLPASSVGAKKSFVDVMLKLSQEKDTLEIVDEEVSNPTYVVDLATMTKDIVDRSLPYGIYHGVNSGACTWCEFAREIFRLANRNVTIIPVGGDKFKRLANRPAFSLLLNNKLPAQRSWQDALADYLKNLA